MFLQAKTDYNTGAEWLRFPYLSIYQLKCGFITDRVWIVYHLTSFSLKGLMFLWFNLNITTYERVGETIYFLWRYYKKKEMKTKL